MKGKVIVVTGKPMGMMEALSAMAGAGEHQPQQGMGLEELIAAIAGAQHGEKEKKQDAREKTSFLDELLGLLAEMAEMEQKQKEQKQKEQKQKQEMPQHRDPVIEELAQLFGKDYETMYKLMSDQEGVNLEGQEPGLKDPVKEAPVKEEPVKEEEPVSEAPAQRIPDLEKPLDIQGTVEDVVAEIHRAQTMWNDDFDKQNTLHDWLGYVLKYTGKASEGLTYSEETYTNLKKAAGLLINTMARLKAGEVALRHFEKL